MKSILKKIDTNQNNAFEIMNVQESYFFPRWHFHPEYEIMLVLEGTGMRFVGDSIERFQPRDLVFYGSDIPHLYRSDKEYYQKETNLMSRAKVIYLRKDFLGQSFWKLSEANPLKKFFSSSKRGIKFKGGVKAKLINLILKIDDVKKDIQNIIDLLTILKSMVDTDECKLLSSGSFTNHIREEDGERMNKVYQFILDNYAKDPSLEEASEIAHMSKTAFCRYFKSHTNKTYTEFLNKIKIGNACKFLIQNELDISQICFESGYNTFTHFNKQFKRNTGFTPSQYKNKYTQRYSRSD